MTCAVTYGKKMEHGVEKDDTEKYLVDAPSFREAEERIVEELGLFITDRFKVTDISRTHYSEVFLFSDPLADRFYKVRIKRITLDEKTGAEKRTIAKMLVQAVDFEGALRKFEKGVRDRLAAYEIIEISETPIVSVLEYKAKEGQAEKSTCRYKNMIELEDGRRANLFKPSTRLLMNRDRAAVFLKDDGEVLIGYFDCLQEGPGGCEVSVLEENGPFKAHRIPFAELKGWGYLE